MIFHVTSSRSRYWRWRTTRSSHGAAAYSRRSNRVVARSIRGVTHGAVRCTTVIRPTRGWIAGTNWIAEAPVPTTTTLRPVRSTSWFQRAEWNTSPAKPSRPGRSGTEGSAIGPLASMSTPAVQRPGAGLDPPALRGVVPGGLQQAAAEADVRQQPVLAGDPSQVVADLGLPGEGAGPVRVGREGQRVQVRRDVAGAARIGVVPPDAADLLLALQHGEVLAAALERVRRGQPAEARADNDDAEVLWPGSSASWCAPLEKLT